ncbi:lachesin, partial [Eurytemora carolleeae]|uniref:lachesin n=1 Tax=Eurytemora carolleeae TaxID=1294199 RepID=UPI000C758854
AGAPPIPLSESSSLIIRDNRFSLRYDTASATYTLQLKDVQTSDEGRYECQIIVGINNKVTESLYLRVLEPPVINDNSTRSVVVDEFNPATLECSARGSPTPRIEWRRENNAVLPTGGLIYRGNTLKIYSVKKEDRGTYFCVADNDVGKPAKRNVALEVEFPPTIVDDVVDRVIEQRYDEAFPPATITWIHNGIQRSVNDRDFALYKGIGVEGSISSTLKIKSLTDELVGNYVCKAANKLGSADTGFKVVRGYQTNCDVGNCDYNSYSRVLPSFILTSFLLSPLFF